MTEKKNPAGTGIPDRAGNDHRKHVDDTTEAPKGQCWFEPETYAGIIQLARRNKAYLEPAEVRLVNDIVATPAWHRLPRWKIVALEAINAKLRSAAGGGA